MHESEIERMTQAVEDELSGTCVDLDDEKLGTVYLLLAATAFQIAKRKGPILAAAEVRSLADAIHKPKLQS